jgi:Tol biopolymer transport system component
VTAWPALTADGRSVIFTREGAGLWQIGLDAQGAHPIQGSTSALYPVATPDGKWIVFSSTAAGVEKLWKVPAEGGPAVQMLDSYSTRPAISPDGKQLAFYYQERPDSAYVLAVMPIDGTRPTATFRVAPSTAFSTVRWTADGKSLLHNSAAGDRANIWLQSLTGGPARQVTHFVDQNILGFDRSLDGKRLIIARGVLNRDAVLIRNFR